MPTSFVHLHVHSDHNHYHGMCPVSALVRRAAELGMPAVALTDTWLQGVPSFLRACREVGTKPIVGMEFLVSGDSLHPAESAHSMLLLAKDNEGYANLRELARIKCVLGRKFPGEPRRLTLDDYASHAKDLICLQVQPRGPWTAFIEDSGSTLTRQLKGIFAPEDIFLEVANHGEKDDRRKIRHRVDLGKRLGLELVATNHVHYLRREDALAFSLLHVRGWETEWGFPERPRIYRHERFKTAAEMQAIFAELPMAFRHTLSIAERCRLDADAVLGSSHPYWDFTFPTRGARYALKEAFRGLSLPEPEAGRLADKIPPDRTITLRKAFAECPDFREAVQGHSLYRKALKMALSLEGVIDSWGLNDDFRQLRDDAAEHEKAINNDAFQLDGAATTTDEFLNEVEYYMEKFTDTPFHWQPEPRTR